jgi:hypothetical protein
MWLGYLDQYPDYATQGISLEDLKEASARLVQRFIFRRDSKHSSAFRA